MPVRLRRASSQCRHRITLDTVQRENFVLPTLQNQGPRVEKGLASHAIEQDVRPGEGDECCVGERDNVQPQHRPVCIEIIIEALRVFRTTHKGDKVFATTHNLWAGGRLWEARRERMLGDTDLMRLVVVRKRGSLVIELRWHVILEFPLALAKVKIEHFVKRTYI